MYGRYLRETAMADELHIYQFDEHDLLQVTDGRPPRVDKERLPLWKLRGSIPATVDEIAKVSAKAPDKVLAEVRRWGTSMLEGRQISPAWRK